MSYLTTNDGVKLYYEDSGAGRPILFIHEFSGDYRAWELQVRYFARRYRCVTYNARGYPPSEVPESLDKYSQRRAVDDARDVLDHLKIEKAHIVGLSMGGFAALTSEFTMPSARPRLSWALPGWAPSRTSGAIPAGSGGRGQALENRRRGKVCAGLWFRAWPEQLESRIRVDSRNSSTQLSEHSSSGAALTLRGVQARRPSPFELMPSSEKMTVPTLVIHGDEDRSCLGTGAFLKRTIPSAGLMVFPKTGHTINLEEPALFNFALQDFFTQVESGRWLLRDQRTENSRLFFLTRESSPRDKS